MSGSYGTEIQTETDLIQSIQGWIYRIKLVLDNWSLACQMLSRLPNETEERQHPSAGTTEVKKQHVKRQSQFRCYRCGFRGHFARNCRTRIKHLPSEASPKAPKETECCDEVGKELESDPSKQVVINM